MRSPIFSGLCHADVPFSISLTCVRRSVGAGSCSATVLGHKGGRDAPSISREQLRPAAALRCCSNNMIEGDVYLDDASLAVDTQFETHTLARVCPRCTWLHISSHKRRGRSLAATDRTFTADRCANGGQQQHPLCHRPSVALRVSQAPNEPIAARPCRKLDRMQPRCPRQTPQTACDAHEIRACAALRRSALQLVRPRTTLWFFSFFFYGGARAWYQQSKVRSWRWTLLR